MFTCYVFNLYLRRLQFGNRVSILLVDVHVLRGSPCKELLGLEPEGDLAGSASLVGVRSMDDVAANINSIVTTDGSGGAVEGVGCSNEVTGCLDHTLSLPDHGDDGARGQEVNQVTEEGASLVLNVVLLSDLLGGGHSLQGNELESPCLELGDDGSNKSTLNAIRLDCNESPLSRHVLKGVCEQPKATQRCFPTSQVLKIRPKITILLVINFILDYIGHNIS